MIIDAMFIYNFVDPDLEIVLFFTKRGINIIGGDFEIGG